MILNSACLLLLTLSLGPHFDDVLFEYSKLEEPKSLEDAERLLGTPRKAKCQKSNTNKKGYSKQSVPEYLVEPVKFPEDDRSSIFKKIELTNLSKCMYLFLPFSLLPFFHP